MTAIRKDPGAEISLAELVAQMPDGCRARREWERLRERDCSRLLRRWPKGMALPQRYSDGWYCMVQPGCCQGLPCIGHGSFFAAVRKTLESLAAYKEAVK